MKKVMVTKGLRGKEDPEAYHKQCLEAVNKYYESLGKEIEITHSTGVSNSFDGTITQKRLAGLGRVIVEELSITDELVLMDDWEKYDGCRSEHFIASQYGIKCVYLSSKGLV